MFQIREKLKGEIPLTKQDLIELVNSWGRKSEFYTMCNGKKIKIKECLVTKRYDLSNVDVSEIEDFSDIFKHSLFCSEPNALSKWNTKNGKYFNSMFYNSDFNGDISNWNVSNGENFNSMFKLAKNFNSPLNWKMSKAKNIDCMFWGAELFNQKLKWNTKNIDSMVGLLYGAESFDKKIDLNITKSKKIFAITDNYNKFKKMLKNYNIVTKDINSRYLKNMVLDPYANKKELNVS